MNQRAPTAMHVRYGRHRRGLGDRTHVTHKLTLQSPLVVLTQRVEGTCMDTCQGQE